MLSADLTPIYVDYHDIISYPFCTKPTLYTMAYKSIFIQTPERIKLHQNSFGDVLHFSVQIEVAKNWTNTLHYNGMWDGNKFFVDNITTLGPNKFIEVVARFPPVLEE
jgi:hypothetical protein